MNTPSTQKDQRKTYKLNYVRERTVKGYPPPGDIKFIRAMQERTGMGESEIVCFLIRIGKETLNRKGINY